MTACLAAQLARVGHCVTVFAGHGQPGSLGAVAVEPLVTRLFEPSPDARADVSMPAERFMVEHDAYLRLGVHLRHARFDVLHNHSLHYLPPVFETPVPMVHTLHSPPTPWLESAFACRARPADVVASVSATNAAAWGPLVDVVVPNGVDTELWRPRGGGDDHAVWTGRLVPEKGPHLAIDAARLAGRRLLLAGPIHDRTYFDREVARRLGPDARYLGHLDAEALSEVVASAAVALATPRWDEPYGLTVAEALATGTPVAAFDRGAVGELIDDTTGALAPPDDVRGLAAAIDRAVTRSRRRCRQVALRRCSVAAMADRYEQIYRSALRPAPTGHAGLRRSAPGRLAGRRGRLDQRERFGAPRDQAPVDEVG